MCFFFLDKNMILTLPWTRCADGPGDSPPGWAPLCAKVLVMWAAGLCESGTQVLRPLPAVAEGRFVHAVSD